METDNAGNGTSLSSQEQYNGILTDLRQALYRWDFRTDRLDWSANAPFILQRDAGKLFETGADLDQAIAGNNGFSRKKFLDIIWGNESAHFRLNYALLDNDAQRIFVEDSGKLLFGEDGCPTGVVGSLAACEAHEIPAPEAQNYDVNSHTPGFHTFKLLAQKYKFEVADPCGAVLVLYVQGLGSLNEVYGVDLANTLLLEVNRRIKAALGQGDLVDQPSGSGYVVGRLSGSRYVVVIDENEPAQIKQLARTIITTVSDHPVDLGGHLVLPRIRIAAVRFPQHVDNIVDACWRAREALRSLLRDGYRNYALWSDKNKGLVRKKKSILMVDTTLQALDEGRVTLAYQPIMNAASNKVEFFEALLRINRDDGRQIAGGEIIPACEEHGLVGLLDRRSINLAMAKLRENPALRISVNASPRALDDENWVARILEELESDPQVARRLIIEITETTAIQDFDAFGELIDQFRKTGTKTAIDDLGSGATTIAIFRSLDLDYVKIDGSFVTGLHENMADQAFIRSIVELSRLRGMRTVAEWVEDIATCDILRDLGVDCLQGFYFGRPDCDALTRYEMG